MLVIPAYAKLNLALAVLAKRGDGFHEIDSVAVLIDWHDLVGVAMRRARSSSVRLLATGGSAVPAGADNIAVRAAEAVCAAVGPLAVDVWLDKRVPAAAGLGGGSADAAAVLRACAALLARAPDRGSRDVALDAAGIDGLAASLGSDVPMLLAGEAQRMRGRGERLERLPVPRLHAVVVVAGDSSTAAAYGALDRAALGAEARVDGVAAALRSGRPPDSEELGSALEAAACRANPELGAQLARLRATLPHERWHMTGSGGAAFALVTDHEAAVALAVEARCAGYTARACRTVSG